MTVKRHGTRRWRTARGRTATVAAALAVVAVLCTGCASTIDIGRLLQSPGEYDGRTVRIEGTVTGGAGLLGVGAYELDDGTGSIIVIAQGQGVPARGTRTRVEGRFEPVFSWAGSTIAAIVQSGDAR